MGVAFKLFDSRKMMMMTVMLCMGRRMGIIQAVVTVCGVFGIIGLLLMLFYHFPGWTWTRTYIFASTKEEKMVLTKQGCMIPSADSDFNLSGRGSFRRFDNTDHDYSLLRQGSTTSLTRQATNIPPQPLRPAPIPPYIIGGPLQSQNSLDSVFSTAPSSPSVFSQSSITIPLTQGNPISSTHPPQDGGGGHATVSGFSNNNPFLPLIQASTQFLTQKFQSFQPHPPHNGANNETTHNETNTSSSSADIDISSSNQAVGVTQGLMSDSKLNSSGQEFSQNPSGSCSSSSNSRTVSFASTTPSLASSGGISMGEILFSSPPAYSLPDPRPPGVNQIQKTEPLFAAAKETNAKLSTRAASEDLQGVVASFIKEQNHRSDSDINPTLKHQTSCDPNAFRSSFMEKRRNDKEFQQSDINYVDHLEAKKFGMPNYSTKVITTTAAETSSYNKPEHQSSPTRIRDRQRKMELTLQHLQNNQEDRSISKKHYNPDSYYPISTPYISKSDSGGGGNDSSGSSSSITAAGVKSRLRTGHRPIPPPLKEADEQIESGLPLLNSSEISDLQNVTQLTEAKGKDELTSNKWILETMREEIRLENERMADATKSLMMEEDFSREKRKTNGIANSTSSYAKTAVLEKTRYHSFETQELAKLNNKRPERQLSCTERDSRKIFHANSLTNSNGEASAYSNLSSSQCSSKSSSNPSSTIIPEPFSVLKSQNDANCGLPSINSGATTTEIRSAAGTLTNNHSLVNSTPPVVVPFRNTRSFSLRQSSTDSIGSEGSDVSSPDGSLPSLQRAMSCDSVSSDTSVILGDLDPPHPTGQLCVGLEYDSETADLLVNVIEAKELVGPDPSSAAPFDSYVRVYLLPDKTTNMQTRVYRKSLNPVYREKFMFGLETMELPLRTLVFYLYSTDKYSNTLVGEAEVKLGDLDIHQPTTTWLQLTDTGQRGGESGEIMFSLSYLPTAERLTLVVVKARNLKFPHERDTGDPFVKVYLLQRGKKVSKKKSSTKRGEKNPIFNEAMIFSVPAHALQTIQLRITVADSSEVEGRAYSVGHVIVGSSTSGKSLSHWNQMLSSLRKPIAMWHPLRK